MPFYAMNPRIGTLLRNVYYDTAANPLLYSIRSIRAVISMVGADKLLYGSDFPLLLYPSRSREADFSLFLSDIRDNAGLSEEEAALFLSGNFRHLLQMP
jgi:predicted TIM-barrel fold metal-dependent hydrolase